MSLHLKVVCFRTDALVSIHLFILTRWLLGGGGKRRTNPWQDPKLPRETFLCWEWLFAFCESLGCREAAGPKTVPFLESRYRFFHRTRSRRIRKCILRLENYINKQVYISIIINIIVVVVVVVVGALMLLTEFFIIFFRTFFRQASDQVKRVIGEEALVVQHIRQHLADGDRRHLLSVLMLIPGQSCVDGLVECRRICLHSGGGQNAFVRPDSEKARKSSKKIFLVQL